MAASLTLCLASVVNADSTSTTTSTSGSSSSSASASATGDKTSTSTSSSSSSNTTSTTTTTETRRIYYDDSGYWRNGSYYDTGYRYSENGYDYYDDGYYDRNGYWHYYSDGGGYWRNGRWHPNETRDSGGYIDNNGNWHSYGNTNTTSRTTTTNNYQYYVVVDRNANTLTVWGKNRWGEYATNQLTVKCATGRNGKTPIGTYTINSKYANGGFQALSDGTYTKSCMSLSNGILIHSVCYPNTNSSPYKEDINSIGTSVTNGNIMLSEKDAASLFDMIVPGTSITIY